MKAQSSLVVLGVIFVALVGLIILQGETQSGGAGVPPAMRVDIDTSEAEMGLDIVSPPGDVSRIFGDLRANNIQAIRFEDARHDDALTLLRREDGDWMALELSSAINQNIAEALAQTIATLSYKDTLMNITPERYHEFGLTLDTVFLLISIIREDGEMNIVAIGRRTPDGRAHYLLIDERDAIYTAPVEPIAFLLTYPAEALRIDN